MFDTIRKALQLIVSTRAGSLNIIAELWIFPTGKLAWRYIGEGEFETGLYVSDWRYEDSFLTYSSDRCNATS